MGRRRTWLWWILAAIVAAWLSWMTLRPNPAVAEDLAPLTTTAARYGVSPRVFIGLAGNVAVFIPLGLALALALRAPCKRRLPLATLIGAAFSMAIELAQSTLPSRVMAPGDWGLNVIGAAVGAALGCWISAPRKQREP